MEKTIQVHPHDVRDEGAETVVANIVDRAGIRTIIAETGTLEERHPYPRGELEHNPVHKVVYTDACFEVPHSSAWFEDLPFRPRLSPQALAGHDYIQELAGAASVTRAEVLPWVKALNAAFEGDVDEACVRTFRGEPIPTWLCPNNPLTERYVKRLILGMLDRYPSRAILVDRLRYPDWSGATVSVERMLTCFCPHCVPLMEEAGVDVDRLTQIFEEFSEERLTLVNWLKDEPTSLLLQSWLRFRQRSISSLAERIWSSVQRWQAQKEAKTAFWLNLWPPSFAALLGQDYASLGRVCEGAKHFPYHRLGGGADLAAFVLALAGEGSTARQEEVFRLLRGLLKLGDVTFSEYRRNGLPLSFVSEQTRWGKNLFDQNNIFAGIQIWDIPVEEIRTTVEAALEGGADGLFFYCYGWATLAALDTVGEIVREL
jgi:hypothetical protein